MFSPHTYRISGLCSVAWLSSRVARFSLLLLLLILLLPVGLLRTSGDDDDDTGR